MDGRELAEALLGMAQDADPGWQLFLDGLPDVVETAAVTCYGAPVQAQGQLADGRFWYFRGRGCVVNLGVGATEREAVEDTMDDRLERGVVYPGYFDASWLDPGQALAAAWELFAARGLA